jgi:hypothetical protein
MIYDLWQITWAPSYTQPIGLEHQDRSCTETQEKRGGAQCLVKIIVTEIQQYVHSITILDGSTVLDTDPAFKMTICYAIPTIIYLGFSVITIRNRNSVL